MASQLPSAEQLALLKVEAAKGSDVHLPARDRRTRARVAAGRDLTRDSTVTLRGEGGPKTYISPGRGDGWVLLAFLDENGTPTYGTYHERDVS